MLLLLKNSNYLDAQDYLDFLPGGAITEAIGWQSGEFAELREQALQEVDLEERKGVLELAQQRINEEGPYAFVLQFGRISATPLKILRSVVTRGV